jgi:tetratricopeptide (TPR) repeat protein
MLTTALLLGLTLHAAAAQQPHDHAAADTRPATLMEGLGTAVHHPIATKVADAQKLFDQGLTLVYAFNHEEAIRSFRRAAELDPTSPMPHWGIALALGPNINLDVDPEREKAAYDAAQAALRLSRRAPVNERAYVNALVKRYSNDPKADLKKLAVAYKDAMRELARTYPDDLDAATLYAESLMDLHPWQLWANDGTPTEGTLQIVAVLEGVLERSPNHVGANHYYIHAVEASLSPDRALPSAKRLETLVPNAGHLVHMPAHTYMRTGDYAGAVAANARAAEVDRKYITETNPGGFYPAMYYNHNLDFLASAAMMTGQFGEALRAADELVTNTMSALSGMPMLEPFGAKKLYVLLRFAKWNDVLALPAPPATARILTALYHFGRGVAFAATGSLAEAAREQASYQSARTAVPDDTAWSYNTAKSMFAVTDAALAARLASARNDTTGAIDAWKKAVAAEDALNYDEPPDWFYPARESLGAALLKAGRYNEAGTVFREDLEKNPENPRSIYGLEQATAADDPDNPYILVLRRHFSDAWAHADVELKLSDY